MVPSAVIEVESMPFTHSGKIDRGELERMATKLMPGNNAPWQAAERGR